MLTVAISTHGGYAHLLPDAVASALLHADEVIVYDDGGGCEPPEGVRYVALPKTGNLTAARRAAIKEAKGDYLLHLDADDWLLSRPPETDADWCYSDVYTCDGSGAITGMWDYGVFDTSREGAMRTLQDRRTLPVPMKAVFRTAWLRENGLDWYEWPHTSFAEDCRTCIEYLEHAPRIAYVPRKPFYVYRLHAAQDTRNDARRSAYLADLDDYLKGDS